MKRSPHSRAIAKLARMLIEQGRAMADNGKALSEIFDTDEGRLRQLAGMVISDVGQCVLLDARSTVMRRELRGIESRVRAAIKLASPDQQPCGAPGCTGYLHLGAGAEGVGHTWCPASQTKTNPRVPRSESR